jgi:aldose 1-epimerase
MARCRSGSACTRTSRSHSAPPAAEVWELVEYLPSGRRLPAGGRYDLRRFRALDGETYDDVLTALEQPFRAALRDPIAGREIVVESDESFRDFVLFAPGHRSIVALEPYSCATDALNLEPRGIDAGLRVLQPGQSWQGRVTIEPRS